MREAAVAMEQAVVVALLLVCRSVRDGWCDRC
jgi:hypothetical protein